MRHFFYTLFFLLVLYIGKAQDIDDYDESIDRRRVHTDFKESLFAIRFSTTLPAPVSNAVLRTKFRGIYEMNLSFNIRLATNFFSGFGFKTGLLGLNNIPDPNTNLKLNTKMQLYTGYLKLGYNKFHTENIFSTFALNLGYNSSFFTGVVNPKNSPIIDKTFYSVLIEPEYSLNFAVEENFSIGIFLSYNYMPTVFNPANIALQDVTSLSGLHTNSSTGIINFGFGFYYGMGKKFARRD
ncbi:MAG TPA: hypothetical protein VF411_07000 [Bacteroidia bacterium]